MSIIKKITVTNLRKMDITIDFNGKFGHLYVTETFRNILIYYFLKRMFFNLESVCCKELA